MIYKQIVTSEKLMLEKFNALWPALPVLYVILCAFSWGTNDVLVSSLLNKKLMDKLRRSTIVRIVFQKRLSWDNKNPNFIL